nr:hypothetical protein GCM10025699_29580 [Microbacterium flavescens]
MKVHNPFRVAFVATLGVGLGLVLIASIQTLSTILLYVGTALFLSLGLDPIVAWLERRKLPGGRPCSSRSWACSPPSRASS